MENLIAILSSSERRQFVRYLRDRNKRQDVRNIDLFRQLTNGNAEQLKKEIGANAYYALTKRLRDNLLDFLGGVLFEQTGEQDVLKSVLVARKLLESGEYAEAFKLLGKAERSARALNDFMALQQIYHLMTEYSYVDQSPDQVLLIAKLEQNTNDLLQNERLNMIFAMIRKAFGEKEYRSSSVRMETFIQDLLSRYQVTEAQAFTFKSLSQMAQIADIFGESTKNYAAVDVFFVNHLQRLAGSSSDTEYNLSFHIDLSYTLANIYFRKREFARSQHYLDYMHLQMQRGNGRYKQRNTLRHRTLLLLTKLLSGKREHALELTVLPQSTTDYPVEDFLKFQLASAMVFFHNQQPDQVRKLLASFSRTDAWYERTAGLEWVLNKTYMEILFYLDLQAFDFVESRLHNFTRKHAQLLKLEEHRQVRDFVKIIRQLCRDESDMRSAAFANFVEKTISWKPADQEDVFYMCYYGWLKAKMKGEKVYEMTLQLMQAR